MGKKVLTPCLKRFPSSFKIFIRKISVYVAVLLVCILWFTYLNWPLSDYGNFFIIYTCLIIANELIKYKTYFRTYIYSFTFDDIFNEVTIDYLNRWGLRRSRNIKIKKLIFMIDVIDKYDKSLFGVTLFSGKEKIASIEKNNKFGWTKDRLNTLVKELELITKESHNG